MWKLTLLVRRELIRVTLWATGSWVWLKAGASMVLPMIKSAPRRYNRDWNSEAT